MGDYQKLDVWKLARILARKVYLVTRHFPPDERFGLTSQTRRAAVSIMSNIAEGRAQDCHDWPGGSRSPPPESLAVSATQSQ